MEAKVGVPSSLDPRAFLTLVAAQSFGALVAADIFYVLLALLINLLHWLAFLRRGRNPKMLIIATTGALLMIAWGTGFNTIINCFLNGQGEGLAQCARHPRRGLCLILVITPCMLLFTPCIEKDRLSRVLLRLGMNWKLLSAFLTVPLIGINIVSTSRRSQLVDRRQRMRRRLIERCRYRVSFFAVAATRAFTSNWMSREAIESRIRSTSPPVFLHNEGYSVGDLVTYALALTFLLVALTF